MSDARYKGFERRIARFLGRLPWLKSLAKSAYQWLNLAFHNRKYSYLSVRPVRPVAPQCTTSFFGYYDRSPENAAGYILFNSSDSNTREAPVHSDLNINVLDTTGKKLLRVSTNAFNWQQGARCLWLNDTQFVYNDVDVGEERYIGRLVDVRTKSVREYARPVQDVYNNEYYLSLCYRRLQALRPDYGYGVLPPLSDAELRDLDDDGIWRVDFSTGADRLIYSLAQAIAIPSSRDFSAGLHKFNHAMISPEGDRFVVLHRRYVDGVREDRLLVCEASGDYMRLLSDAGMVSHCTWISNTEILGYMRGPNEHDGYWIVDVESGQMRTVADGKLDMYGDGHPHAQGDWFVTDTYPDKAAMQILLLCNWRTGQVHRLGEFFHGLVYRGESRCDLHPRLSPDGRRVYFDSVFSGERQLYVMELAEA